MITSVQPHKLYHGTGEPSETHIFMTTEVMQESEGESKLIRTGDLGDDHARLSTDLSSLKALFVKIFFVKILVTFIGSMKEIKVRQF